MLSEQCWSLRDRSNVTGFVAMLFPSYTGLLGVYYDSGKVESPLAGELAQALQATEPQMPGTADKNTSRHEADADDQ